MTQILAALLEGGGAHLVVSMTHRTHDLVSHRLGHEPIPKLLTGGVACYRIYATADGRFLTVAALEPVFWQRLCEVVGVPGLVERQWEPRLPELEAAIASRPLAEWLELFDGEDVSAGPVWTLAEAAAEFASAEHLGAAPHIGRAHRTLAGRARSRGRERLERRRRGSAHCARCSPVVSTSTPAPASTMSP